MIPGALNPMLMSAGKAAYQVLRSLRLRRSASAYLNRTFANGSATQWTHSHWLKRGTIDAYEPVFMSSLSGGEGAYFHSDNTLVIAINGAVMLKSNKVFRDPTAHLHLVFASDMGNATAALKFRVFVNNEEITSWSTDVRASYSSWTYWNRAAAASHYIGYSNALGAYADSYRSEVVHVDGAVAAPSAFGEYDSSNNWRPKKYEGVYGTTGFYLDFSDPTSTTTLMADRSGNGNNWTANNISVTAGVTYDSMLDVPLGGGGNERGNYCTLDPMRIYSMTLDNGNLRANGPSGARSVFGSQAIRHKVYAEVELTTVSSGNNAFGVAFASAVRDSYYGTAQWVVRAQEGNFYASGASNPGGSGAPYGSISSGSIGRIAFDPATGKLWLGAGVSWFNGGDPAAGTGYVAILSTSEPAFFSGAVFNDVQNWNFGQRPFSYSVPAGFKAQHTGNLTDDTVITSGSFTGNASTDGPRIEMNGAPETLTINGNAVTWGVHADRLANGFKVRSSSSSYNASSTNTWNATVLSPASRSAFRRQLAKTN